MQKTKSYEGLTVRVPINMAKELKKLKVEKDLPSMGSALQIYIENMKIERVEERLDKVEKAVKKNTKHIDQMLKSIGELAGMIQKIKPGVAEFIT